MPRVMMVEDDQSCELAECVDALQCGGFDPADEASLSDAARWLRRLGNNTEFLGDMLIEELKQRHVCDEASSSYGPQVVTLSRPQGDFFLRANLWPSADEHMFRASGGGSFVYGLPHDHNFDFLTHGYFGPGYWSEYYEYDFEAVDGFAGEPAGLRFIERSRLEPGKIQHYRAHLDVHRQLPPDSLSVSLNILHMDGAQGWMDQYGFDVERNEIARILNPGSSDVFLRIATGLGGPEALELAESFGRSHPSDRMRLAAWEAQAGQCPETDARDRLWARAELSGSRMIAAEAKARRLALNQIQ